MSDGAASPTVYTIPAHRSFADSLAAGLIARHGRDPMALAGGRILLPNNRAVRALTEAFVRASGSGLVLPRLIAIGDPELDDRIGGALDPAGAGSIVPRAIDPLARQLALAGIVRRGGEGAAEAMRLAADLARTLDSLTIEEVPASKLTEAAAEAPDLAGHWQVSLDRLQAIIDAWPAELARRGAIDLTDRRNRLLRATAERWLVTPPPGFIIAAGITTAAPAVAALLRSVSRMAEGAVVLPALALAEVMNDEEWDALGPDDNKRSEESHPQYHLKLLLDRIGVARGEVAVWRGGGRAASPAVRGRAVANAMTAADFSDKWSRLPPRERRLTGIRAAELADPASEAMAIAIALRQSVETPGQTAALVTPDRILAARVSALLGRWGIEADDSAGRALSQAPAGTLLLAIAAAAAEGMAPVAMLALVKHPLVGGDAGERQDWLAATRILDRGLRGPRPPAGLAGLDAHFAGKDAETAWSSVRPKLEPVESLRAPCSLSAFAASLRSAATVLAGNRAWSGPDGRLAAQLIAELEAAPDAASLMLDDQEWVPLLRDMLDVRPVRPPYGGHPRISIWGLLEARLQHADLMILGGLNEGVWPSLPALDPWLAPKIRAILGLPGLDFRVGLSAHDFASALGAPRVLITRARRDSKSPTVASRLWLRLMAMTGGLARDLALERFVAAIDDPGEPTPVGRPAPAPPAAERPRKISVTQVDRLKADPFAFYASAMLGLNRLDPVDADHSAAWKGSAVHQVLEHWLRETDCSPDDLVERARALVAGDAIHPMLRALWQPRLIEAINWIADQERANRAKGRSPIAAEAKGETLLGEITLHGRADRIDRLADGDLAIIDYKTGQPPQAKAVEAGFALQLGLLGLIARAGGFGDAKGDPGSHEYWSLARDSKGGFGKKFAPDAKVGAQAFLETSLAHFLTAAADYLTGDKPFTAKLHPAYAPYGDYDQLMRLDEWYGRD
ncbi:MAG: PD-(D/E)XK nuclease family protein [Sphingomonas bacterium]|nr:PD-(D/E)XK nuclease family protein [Sphingomonas bacterium]